jgi:uncharacterized coiled-coil protein SlyX
MRPDYNALERLAEALEKENAGKDALIDSLNRYIEALEKKLDFKEQTIRELRERVKAFTTAQRGTYEKR